MTMGSQSSAIGLSGATAKAAASGHTSGSRARKNQPHVFESKRDQILPLARLGQIAAVFALNLVEVALPLATGVNGWDAIPLRCVKAPEWGRHSQQVPLFEGNPVSF
jgi:hypothetical protein